MRPKENNISFLQYTGLGVLGMFFFMYTLGSIYGNEDAYSTLFYVAVLIAGALLLKDRTALRQYKRYYIWQTAFILLISLSVLYTVNPNPTPYVVQMFKILLKVTTVAIICKNYEGVKKLLLCIAFVGVAVFFALYTRGLLNVVGRLGNEIMGNANSFGLMTTVFYVGAFSSISNVKDKYLKYFFIFAVVLDIVLMTMTGGRKFLLFAMVFMFSSLLAQGTIKPGRLLLVGFVTGIIVVIMSYIIMNVGFFYDAIGYRFDGMSSGQAEGVDDQEYLMQKGIEIFKERPFWGWGVEGYRYASKTGFYAHSNYVELLADYGIIGTLLYYSNLLWCALVMWRKRMLQEEEFKFYFPLLISIFVLDVFSISFNQTAYIPLFIMFITGYCYRLSRRKKLLNRVA